MSKIKTEILNRIRRIPFFIPLFTFIIFLYGIVILYSASGGVLKPYVYKQTIIFFVFISIAFLIAIINLELIFRFSYFIYWIAVILLLFVEFFGKSYMGAIRWIDLGIIRIQPSEITKIAIVLMLARYFSSNAHDRSSYFLTFVLIPFIAVLIPALLIIKQPDLGTGIVILLIAFFMFFAFGIRITYFYSFGFLVALLGPIIWHMMHGYQKRRVLVFFNPEIDALGAGYNIIQSKIAIGSGGLFGKGFMSGTQSHFHFLPEYKTDFIFAFLAEELGFIGGFTLIVLYTILIICLLLLLLTCRSMFAKLIIIGVTSIFFCHIFINIAMVMGLVPVVGMPLPLVSYGGSMLSSMLVGIGLIMNSVVNYKYRDHIN